MSNIVDKFFDIKIPPVVAFLIAGLVAGAFLGWLVGRFGFGEPSTGTGLGVAAGLLIAIVYWFVKNNSTPPTIPPATLSPTTT